MKVGKKEYGTQKGMSKRLFVGVFVNKEWQEKFAKYQRAFPSIRGMRWVGSSDLHMTVLFIGQMSKQKLPLFQAQLLKIAERHEPFVLHFDRFRQAPPHAEAPTMLWAQYKMQGEFELLAQDIKKMFMSISIFDEDHKKIIPHVTLARMKGMPILENIDVSMKEKGMPFDEICLVESNASGDVYSYKVLQRYTLGKRNET